MTIQRMQIRDIQQTVQNARVTEIDLRRLDLALSDIFMPRLKLAHHIGPGEQIEIVTDSFVRKPHRASELRCIPNLPMEMSQHRPETTQGCGRYGNSQRRYVAFQKGPQKSFAPCSAICIGFRRNARGNPPCSQRRCQEEKPTSSKSNPASSINSIRPARLSDAPLTKVGLALPELEPGLASRTVNQHPQC